MPEYLAPGVFVEEIDSGSKPIEGVGTSTAAFVGFAKSGEFDKPIFISNWGDFHRFFGEDENEILVGLAKETGRKVTDLLEAKRKARKPLADFAAGVLDSMNGSGKPWAKFCQDHGIPQDNSPYMPNSYMAIAVKGFFDNGGGRAYIVRVPREEDLKALKYTPDLGAGKSATLSIAGITVKALEPGTGGNSVSVEVTHTTEPADGFVLKVTKGDGAPETFGNARAPLTPANFAETVTKTKSKVVEFTATTVQERPAVGTFNLTGGVNTSDSLPALPLDKELAKATPNDLQGREERNSGLYALSMIDEMLMVCVPDLMAGLFPRSNGDTGQIGSQSGLSGLTEARKKEILAAQKLVIDYCERRADSVAVLDPLPELEPDEMRQTISASLSCDKGHATVYYPWVKVMDPIRSRYGKKEQILIPPCGHVAGVWARTDVTRGVHKAPANEAMLGIVDLERKITKGEQEILNPNGINCIRTFPGMGIRIWGARTLATNVNPSWKYLNVRRLFDYLEKSIEKNMSWAVFEPNDQDLWARLRRNISAFLFTEWKEGKLFGTVPAEAYYVKCDAETNPQEMIDLGRVYVEVGVNPVKPAEFVIIRIGQWSSGGATTEA